MLRSSYCLAGPVFGAMEWWPTTQIPTNFDEFLRKYVVGVCDNAVGERPHKLENRPWG